MTMVSVHYLRCCHLNFRYGAWSMILTIHLNHLINLAKWLSVHLRTKRLWVRITLLSLKLQIWRLLRARSSLTFRQTIECRFTLKLVPDMIVTYTHITSFFLNRSKSNEWMNRFFYHRSVKLFDCFYSSWDNKCNLITVRKPFSWENLHSLGACLHEATCKW